MKRSGLGARALARAGCAGALRAGAVFAALGGALWCLEAAVAQGQPLGGAAGEAVALRVGWRAGQTVRYQVETRESVEGTPGVRETRAEVSVQTVSVEAGGAATQWLRVESLRLDAGTVTEGTEGRLVQGMRAAEVRYRQDDRGVVHDTSLEGLSEAERGRVGALLASLQQLGPTLPERALRVGDIWESQSQQRVVPGPGGAIPLDTRQRYTLRALHREQGRWVVELDTVSTTRIAQGHAVGGMALRAEGEATGSVRYDLGRATVLDSRARGTLTLEMTVRGRPLVLRARVESSLRALPGDAAAPRVPRQAGPG